MIKILLIVLMTLFFFSGCEDRPSTLSDNDSGSVYMLDNKKITIPVSNAGTSANVHTLTVITLDGSSSVDSIQNISYQWSFIAKPTGSQATLSDTTIVNPSFTTDKMGVYEIKLIVNNGFYDSTPSSVTVTATNIAPIAATRVDQTIHIGTQVQLDGNNSSDADGDLLTYSWSFISKPAGNTATLSDPTSVNPNFTADVLGNYDISLVVNDGFADSTPSSVSIVGIPPLADFTMVLDVNESNVTTNWKNDSNSSVTATVTIDTQGKYGSFVIQDNIITYLKTVETNSTDSGVVNIDEDGNIFQVIVTVNSLYWKSISAGYNYTVAIKSDGSLWAWGSNSNGQLGDGTTTDRSTPTQEISASTNWNSVSAEAIHTVAIKSDGSLWAWGSNSYGQLGDGTTTDRLTHIQENSDSSNWTSVSTESYHAVAIKSDGSLWAWGSNSNGQLGDGTTVNKLVPTQPQPRK